MKIYEPSRRSYRKKIAKSKGCKFCDFAKIKNQICESLSGKNWQVIVNLYPYMDGNLMIISKRHVEDINGMNDLERTEFFEVLEKTKKKLSKIFETDDFNIGLNIGKKAGASIKHLHWQVIPRREKILNASNVFGDLYVITVSPRELKKMIDKK